MIELLQPTPAETLELLRGNTTFRSLPLAADGLPPKVILNQSRYLLTDAPLSYRWTIPFLIVFDGRIVGSIGGKGLLPDEDTVELGYNVATGYRRRGIATEAVRRIREMAAADGLVVMAHVEPKNLPSKVVLIKNDFRREATITMPGGFDLERWVTVPGLRPGR